MQLHQLINEGHTTLLLEAEVWYEVVIEGVEVTVK